jgi:hypothetical protein
LTTFELARVSAEIVQLFRSNRFLLPIGSVEPHYFAGLTGAHKTVTIRLHVPRRTSSATTRALWNPAFGRACGLDGNLCMTAIVNVLRGYGSGRKEHRGNQPGLSSMGGSWRSLVGDPLDTLRRAGTGS